MSHTWNPDLSLLLSTLPTSDRQHLQAHLMPIELQENQTLYESNKVLNDVFFPTSATISLRYVLQDGAQTEIAEIGNEGMAGISVLLKGNTTPSRAVVQCAGYAYRLCAADLYKLLDCSPTAATLFSRYTLALMMHIAQTGVCNRHHDTEQRFCRWLLAAADRRRSQEVAVTQEQIANILGVRRAGERRVGKHGVAGTMHIRVS